MSRETLSSVDEFKLTIPTISIAEEDGGSYSAHSNDDIAAGRGVEQSLKQQVEELSKKLETSQKLLTRLHSRTEINVLESYAVNVFDDKRRGIQRLLADAQELLLLEHVQTLLQHAKSITKAIELDVDEEKLNKLSEADKVVLAAAEPVLALETLAKTVQEKLDVALAARTVPVVTSNDSGFVYTAANFIATYKFASTVSIVFFFSALTFFEEVCRKNQSCDNTILRFGADNYPSTVTSATYSFIMAALMFFSTKVVSNTACGIATGEGVSRAITGCRAALCGKKESNDHEQSLLGDNRLRTGSIASMQTVDNAQQPASTPRNYGATTL